MSAKLYINLKEITKNAVTLKKTCNKLGVNTVGVVKCVCGDHHIANAVLKGGIERLGDSRIENIINLRQNGVTAPIYLLRSPILKEVDDCVDFADVSLNSDIHTLRKLSEAAVKKSKKHGVILMLDLNTGREGFLEKNIIEICEEVISLPNIELMGIGVYCCFKSSLELHKNVLNRLSHISQNIRKKLNVLIPVVSGGSTNVFNTLYGNRDLDVSNITELRIGTSLLLGIHSSCGPVYINGFCKDTFVLESEFIEIKRSSGIGILAFGRVDTEPEYIFPTCNNVKVKMMNCDHTVVEFSEGFLPKVGDKMKFRLGYYALNRLMISPYTQKVYLE